MNREKENQPHYFQPHSNQKGGATTRKTTTGFVTTGRRNSKTSLEIQKQRKQTQECDTEMNE